MKLTSLSKFVDDVRDIVKKYRTEATLSLNMSIIHERWEIGQRIVEEDQNGELRAEYGTNLINVLSKELTFELGKGYNPRSLAYYRQLYVYFPNVVTYQGCFRREN